jgi:hypothetical protein
MQHPPLPELNASLISRLLFSWLTPLITCALSLVLPPFVLFALSRPHVGVVDGDGDGWWAEIVGAQRPLELSDVFDIAPQDNPVTLERKLKHEWMRRRNTTDSYWALGRHVSRSAYSRRLFVCWWC